MHVHNPTENKRLFLFKGKVDRPLAQG